MKSLATQKMRSAILILVCLCAAATSCARHSAPPPPPQNAAAPAPDPEILCGRIAEIKSVPFKDEKVDDAAYNALVDAGEKALPCLIEKVTDATPMDDPRSIPGPTDTRVGDVAFFVFIDIAKVEFESMLPPELVKRLPEEGVYAYHDFMGEKSNRQRLQSTLREWYRQKYGKYPVE